jgi:hypothetical protein
MRNIMEDMNKALDSWRTLNKMIGNLDENQLRSLINFEVSTYKRQDILTRLHQRFNKLRAARERVEISNGGLI